MRDETFTFESFTNWWGRPNRNGQPRRPQRLWSITPVHLQFWRARTATADDVAWWHSTQTAQWTLMCRLRLPDCEKRSRQTLHWYGFSPEWIRRCLVSVELSENVFLHSRQRYGRSPECVLRCVVTDELWEKLRLQTGQRKGFSPLCVRTWAVRLAACENDLRHVVQT